MYCQEEGDIIFQEEGHWRDKLSRYIMSSKSIWHFLSGKRETVLFYHVSVAYADRLVIEQKRWGIQMVNWKPHKKQIIFRPLLNRTENFIIIKQKYDFLNCFGHLLAWLTGIQIFRCLHSKNRQNCVLMGMRYCQDNCNEKFPVKKLWEFHTQDFYKYLLNNPYYEIVYTHE